MRGLPLERVPRSHSVAPAPRPTERSLAAMQRVLREREFPSHADLNAFLNSPEGQQALANAPTQGRWEEAQEVAYQAWEAGRPARYALARRALEIDDRCSDAWLILAEEERVWRKQRRCFERAVAAADRACQEEGWLQALGGEGDSLYNHVPGRSYLRAHVALARCLSAGGYHREARALYEKVLRLDPEDHMAIRYEILPVYHELDDRDGLRKVVFRFEDDFLPSIRYERLWLAIVDGRDEAEIRKLVGEARAANPHVLAMLLGKENPFRDSAHISGGYMPIGGAEEAAHYAIVAARWWFGEPRAWAWLQAERAREAAGG